MGERGQFRDEELSILTQKLFEKLGEDDNAHFLGVTSVLEIKLYFDSLPFSDNFSPWIF